MRVESARHSPLAKFVGEPTARMDFANILFSGPCNRFCPWCIGKQVPAQMNVNNLSLFPPRNIDGFIEKVNELGITQIVFTGTISDPQLYKHEAQLLSLLREKIDAGATYSVHTNGVLALKKMDVFNLYDKSCISFPSFNPETYFKLMGAHAVPDLAAIIGQASIEVKVSCVINEHNVNEVDSFLERCAEIGVKRVVLRKLFGETREWEILQHYAPVRFYRTNPVYRIHEMEVTYWNFDTTTSRSINLFPNGILGLSYLLTETSQFAAQQERAGSPLRR